MVGTAHVYQIDIAATPEEVWRAITDSEWTKRYFHLTSFVAPPVAGAAYRTVLAAEPPGRVEWTVEGVGESLTRIRLVHGDLAYSPLTWAHVKDGWVWVIDALKTLLETGKSLPGPEGW
jgi:Activator of Hsp90 ATPase homolog 1-like protein